MANPVSFIFGYKRIYALASDGADILNLCAKNAIPYKLISSKEDALCFECSLFHSAILEKECKAAGITLIEITEHGLPFIFMRYRHRYGLFLGAIFAVLILYLSQIVIWDIRIDGAIRLDRDEILDDLETCGIKVGSRISEIDVDVIQNRMIIYSDDISWISINLSGNVAYVEIREAEPIPPEKTEYRAANLVATREGIIEGFAGIRGDVAVKIGDTVSEGELLVSGIRESKTQGFTYTCAEGEVFARCESAYSVEIPLKFSQKKYTGVEYTEKYLIFFDKEIKIYSNIGKMNTSCDIIDTEEFMKVFDKSRLPFGVRTVRYKEYEYVTALRTPNEAIDLAFSALVKKEEELGVGDVISKQLLGSLTDKSYRLDCVSVSVMNIAKQKKIDILP